MENLNLPHHNKYHKGQIYKITDIAYTECYIGSTVQPLCNRMAEHRRHYQQYKRGTKKLEYRSFNLFDKYGVEHCKIELVEAYKCETRDALVQREGYWIRLEETCLNKKVAGRSRKGYTLETKDIKREYDKNYRKQNIDRIKKYRQENRERISEYNKRYLANYYQENKDKLNAKTTCAVCGSCFIYGHKARHEKSQKHLVALENNK